MTQIFRSELPILAGIVKLGTKKNYLDICVSNFLSLQEE